MERPMTTEELFEKICSLLKEKGKLPDILDYHLGPILPKPITIYAFDVRNNLDYGGSEGIYLDLTLKCCEGKTTCFKDLGTFKTLGTSDQDMHIMAALLADFMIEATRYINANLDDFTWEGADVHPVDDSGEKALWGYSCHTMEDTLKKKDELLKKFQKVVVRDNATRKEIVYSRERKHLG